MYEKIEAHQRSSAHITCYLTWKDLEKSLNESVGIDNSLQKQYATEMRKWREVFRCILDVVLFLSERNLPFRGSTTKLDDPNNGLFLGNLELLSSHNQVLKMHLNEVKRNQETETQMRAHYLSWRSQNEFIQECAKIVINAIIDEVKRALYYSIIVDGTPDTSHTEQITFILRYAHLNEENLWEVSERFLQMEDCEKKKGCDIAELICKVLKEHNIPLKNCRGQRYDNGSNMSGCYKGAQSLIREKNPQAVFCPCSAHTLNLCGVHAAESNNVVKNFFGNIQKLYNLFSCSPSRWKILQEIAHISLHKLSVTRWSARIEAVKPLVKKPREILEALESLNEHDLPGDLWNDVESLSKWLRSFEYTLLVTFWFKILQAINDVSLLLQGSGITLDKELRLIKSLQGDLKRIREAWAVILEESKLVAGALGLNEQFQEKRRRIRKAFFDENHDNEWAVQGDEELFRINVFNVTLDTVIGEMTRRFQTSEQLNNMFCFLWTPSSITENSRQSEDVESTRKSCCHDLSKFYPDDLNGDQIFEELRLLKLKQNDNLVGKLSSLQLLNKIYEKGLQSIFPQICVALRIFVSIPVSAASGERSFSKLAIVKNCRRSTMGQERLSGLITLSSETDMARKINYDTVIEAFALRCARKARI